MSDRKERFEKITKKHAELKYSERALEAVGSLLDNVNKLKTTEDMVRTQRFTFTFKNDKKSKDLLAAIDIFYDDEIKQLDAELTEIDNNDIE